ncbi:ATP-binding protein [Microbacterium sp. NPDC089189]|uniref:sensor histidine kinase n=1 Tax=Microbacterium sp. NPDC089189 TaxID=3154972 RepID=UPI00342AA352
MSATSADSGAILTRTVEALSSARTLERVMSVVADAARSLTGADGATFVLREDDDCFYADEQAIGPLWKGQRFAASSCVSGWAMTHGMSVVIPDVFADARVPHDAYRRTFVKSMCMTPVRPGDPIAAIGTYWSTEHTIDAVTVRQLEMLADSTAIALENLELRGSLSRRAAERDQHAERADELEAAIHSLVHDLRSPLGAMVGYADLIVDETDAPDVARHAQTIVRAGERMAAQIDRMLSIYRITHHPLVPQPVDLSELGREIADDLMSRVGERHVHIDVDDGLNVVADPVLAGLMVENLLDNAVKYTSKKREARISLRRVDRAAPLSTFAVSDNGAGFDPAGAASLFRPLVRLHAEEDFPGTGLGLASVARIVQLHGGVVRAEGIPAHGASFYFSLPVPA